MIVLSEVTRQLWTNLKSENELLPFAMWNRIQIVDSGAENLSFCNELASFTKIPFGMNNALNPIIMIIIEFFISPSIESSFPDRKIFIVVRVELGWN